MFGPEYIWSWLWIANIKVNIYLHLCWLKPMSKFNVRIPLMNSHGITTPLLIIQTNHEKMKIWTSGCPKWACNFIYLIELAPCIQLNKYILYCLCLPIEKGQYISPSSHEKLHTWHILIFIQVYVFILLKPTKVRTTRRLINDLSSNCFLAWLHIFPCATFFYPERTSFLADTTKVKLN